MDKKSFLKNFSVEDMEELAGIYEKIIISNKKDIEAYNNEFYPPNIWAKLTNLNLGVNIFLDGYFDLSDRKMIIFNKEDNFICPYSILMIKNKSKFNKLAHSDYLGALMALGIKRSKFGDLIVKDDKAYVPVINEIKDYIEYNLNFIGKAPCDVKALSKNECENLELNPEVLDANIIVTSMRLDCVVSSISKLSRSDCDSFIKQGKVMINYNQVYDKSKEVKLGDTLTIRGYGKLTIFDKQGLTSSGRIKLSIKKYK